jgi:hypothetical protein
MEWPRPRLYLTFYPVWVGVRGQRRSSMTPCRSSMSPVASGRMMSGQGCGQGWRTGVARSDTPRDAHDIEEATPRLLAPKTTRESPTRMSLQTPGGRATSRTYLCRTYRCF